MNKPPTIQSTHPRPGKCVAIGFACGEWISEWQRLNNSDRVWKVSSFAMIQRRCGAFGNRIHIEFTPLSAEGGASSADVATVGYLRSDTPTSPQFPLSPGPEVENIEPRIFL